MNIPFDRLYDFLRDVSGHDDIIIYLFDPPGSKNFTDCIPHVDTTTVNFKELLTTNQVIFHDQEPLTAVPELKTDPRLQERFTGAYLNINNKVILVHSEKNSNQLDEFEKHNFIGVYYWCHALIARDWYRYAVFDPQVKIKKSIEQDFLIYNRAWAGTREYRLKLSELLIEHNLTEKVRMKFNPVDTGIHYHDHKFKNLDFVPVRKDIELYFPLNQHPSTSSGDYVFDDYQHTFIEVVLETLFDDSRIQLTEKVLRPIACQQPFILASTPGSLGYLKDYGFKTFDQWIDESYDNIEDPYQRLRYIVLQLEKLAALPQKEKIKMQSEMQIICKHNYNLFFSDKFYSNIIEEYKTNLNNAIKTINQDTNKGIWFKRWREQFPSTEQFSKIYYTTSQGHNFWQEGKYITEDDILYIESLLKSSSYENNNRPKY